MEIIFVLQLVAGKLHFGDIFYQNSVSHIFIWNKACLVFSAPSLMGENSVDRSDRDVKTQRKNASSESFPQENSPRSWERVSLSMHHSFMTFRMFRHEFLQGLVGRRRIVQQRDDEFTVAVRQENGSFLGEADLILGNDLSLANTKFSVADLLDQDRNIGERLRKAHAGLLVRGSSQGRHK